MRVWLLLSLMAIGLLGTRSWAVEASLTPNCAHMNAQQCKAWQAFWPAFQKDVLAAEKENMRMHPLSIRPGTEESKAWIMQHETQLKALRLAVISHVAFPFKDDFRRTYTQHGLPAEAADSASFLAIYDYVFTQNIVKAIRDQNYACFYHFDPDAPDGDAYHCDWVDLKDQPEQISLQFVSQQNGEYRLARIPYVE